MIYLKLSNDLVLGNFTLDTFDHILVGVKYLVYSRPSATSKKPVVPLIGALPGTTNPT